MKQSVDGDIEYLVPGGQLRKRVLELGDGEPAGKGSRVVVRYSIRLQSSNEVFDSSSTRPHGLLEFTLGKGKVIPALELAAETMPVGEKCEVSAEPSFAFGEKGLKRKGVPPNAPVVLCIEMTRFEGAVKKKGVAEMSSREIYEEALQFKERGNQLFKEAKFDKAVVEYSKAIRYLAQVFFKPSQHPKTTVIDEELPPNPQSDSSSAAAAPSKTIEKVDLGSKEEAPNDAGPADGFEEAEIIAESAKGLEGGNDSSLPSPSPTKADSDGQQLSTNPSGTERTNGANASDPSEVEVSALRVKTLTNLSLCCIRLGDFKSAEESSSFAISVDPQNAKALYYRGRARAGMGHWDEAQLDLIAASKMKPKDMGIKTELERVEKKLKQQKAKEKKQAEAMFA